MQIKRCMVVTFAVVLCAMMVSTTPIALAGGGGNQPTQAEVFGNSSI